MKFLTIYKFFNYQMLLKLNDIRKLCLIFDILKKIS